MRTVPQRRRPASSNYILSLCSFLSLVTFLNLALIYGDIHFKTSNVSSLALYSIAVYNTSTLIWLRRIHTSVCNNLPQPPKKRDVGRGLRKKKMEKISRFPYIPLVMFSSYFVSVSRYKITRGSQSATYLTNAVFGRLQTFICMAAYRHVRAVLVY